MTAGRNFKLIIIESTPGRRRLTARQRLSRVQRQQQSRLTKAGNAPALMIALTLAVGSTQERHRGNRPAAGHCSERLSY